MKQNGRRYAFIDTHLEERRRRNRLRALQPLEHLPDAEVRINGNKLINFCSNDYLGLSQHPLLKARAVEFTERYGVGSTASRLICGTVECFQRIEQKLAALKGSEAALILNSGYQANVSILPALADRQTLILSDVLNHNSIIQGALLSRCYVERFRHNDVQHVRELLHKHYSSGYSRTIIITESIFSVDGDKSDIATLSELAEEYEALLVVDEAHATGVVGERGMGLTCGKKVDLTIGTFGKACGSFGAYVTCSERLCEYLINRCSGFIYTTALPPAVLGAIDAALDLIPQMDGEREQLHANSEFVRSSLHELGYNTGDSTSQIIPIIMGEETEALKMSNHLEEKGILALAIRPPTVPLGQSRIRLSLSALHTKQHIERLLDVFAAHGSAHAG